MKPLTKRASLAVECLQKSPTRSVHSFQLNSQLRTNFSPRAIHEAKQSGYVIVSTPERFGNAWGVRYTLSGISPSIASSVEQNITAPQEVKYEFQGSEMIRVAPPHQEALV